MLFSRLFNWVRYKTLPPSALFLNRLFVERDSKHRRVTSNLGLTFRNSKWSSYARTNVQSSDRHSYLSEIGLILAVILGLTVLGFVPFHDLLAQATLLLSPVIWFLADADLYLKAVFSSASLCLLQVTLNDISGRIFGTQSKSNGSTTPHLATSKFKDSVSRLHKPLFYSHLTRSNTHLTVDAIYDASAPNSVNMIKSVYALQHINSSLNLFQNPSSRLNSPSSLDSLVTLNRPDLQVLALESQLFSTSAPSPSLPWLENWTLKVVHVESQASASAFPTGSIYVPTVDLNNLNKMSQLSPELLSLRQSVDNHLSLIRWNRWLYKFSLIHRNSFRMVHKYTDVKKLLGVGFFDRDIFTRNMWASASFSGEFQADQKVATVSDFTKFDKVGPALFRELYGDYLGQGEWSLRELTQTSRSLQTPSINALRFYESGYYWWLQRSALTMSTASDSILSAPMPVSRSVASDSKSLETLAPFLRAELRQITQSPFYASQSSLDESEVSKASVSNDLYLSYASDELMTPSITSDVAAILRNTAHPVFVFYGPRRLS